MAENGFDILVIGLGICLILLLAVIFILKFMGNVYMPFVEERDIIKMEIMRSHGDERVHWQHELQRLYMSMIPIVGGILVRRSMQRGRRQRR